MSRLFQGKGGFRLSLFGYDLKADHEALTGGKDPLCKVPIKDESLLVDASTKGLQNVLIFAVEASRVHPDLAGASKEALFDQKECRFLDHVFAVSIKDKLWVLNGDTTGHNTNATPGRGNKPFNNLVAINDRFEVEMKNPTPSSPCLRRWAAA